MRWRFDRDLRIQYGKNPNVIHYVIHYLYIMLPEVYVSIIFIYSSWQAVGFTYLTNVSDIQDMVFEKRKTSNK